MDPADSVMYLNLMAACNYELVDMTDEMLLAVSKLPWEITHLEAAQWITCMSGFAFTKGNVPASITQAYKTAAQYSRVRAQIKSAENGIETVRASNIPGIDLTATEELLKNLEGELTTLSPRVKGYYLLLSHPSLLRK